MTRVEQARRRIEARIYQDAIGESTGSRWTMLVPLLTEHGFAARVLRKRLGLPTPAEHNRPPRHGTSHISALCAGPGDHTDAVRGVRHLHGPLSAAVFSQHGLLDHRADPAAARHGAQQHVIAPLEELDRHFPPGHFDLIVCNGVYGWGLDRHDQLEAAFAQCHSRLKDDGHLFFGWDDIPQRAPVDLDTVSSRGLLRQYTFPPLGTWRYLTDTPYRHTFDFYRK